MVENPSLGKKASWKGNLKSVLKWLPIQRQPIPFTQGFTHALKCGFCIMGTATFKIEMYALFSFCFLGAVTAAWQFQDQGSNPPHSSDLTHCSDNARSLTCWATRELQKFVFDNVSLQTFASNVWRVTRRIPQVNSPLSEINFWIIRISKFWKTWGWGERMGVRGINTAAWNQASLGWVLALLLISQMTQTASSSL